MCSRRVTRRSGFAWTLPTFDLESQYPEKVSRDNEISGILNFSGSDPNFQCNENVIAINYFSSCIINS